MKASLVNYFIETLRRPDELQRARDIVASADPSMPLPAPARVARVVSASTVSLDSDDDDPDTPVVPDSLPDSAGEEVGGSGDETQPYDGE
mmetsp:Transcript_22430/g.53073  ORF Transcript_22430/g.53073 Transcript_22430/m.53073 type:complete len:90 (-) Transcript_22430:21-290(-)